MDAAPHAQLRGLVQAALDGDGRAWLEARRLSLVDDVCRDYVSEHLGQPHPLTELKALLGSRIDLDTLQDYMSESLPTGVNMLRESTPRTVSMRAGTAPRVDEWLIFFNAYHDELVLYVEEDGKLALIRPGRDHYPTRGGGAILRRLWGHFAWWHGVQQATEAPELQLAAHHDELSSILVSRPSEGEMAALWDELIQRLQGGFAHWRA